MRARFRHFRRNLRAAVRIQSFVRGCLARKKLHKIMSPNRWTSPSKKELSYCRDMKNLLSKVALLVILDEQYGSRDESVKGSKGVA